MLRMKGFAEGLISHDITFKRSAAEHLRFLAPYVSPSHESIARHATTAIHQQSFQAVPTRSLRYLNRVAVDEIYAS